MAETTLISWADSTLNVWMGCQETGSPACERCYARALVEGRFGLTTWGPHGKRIETKSWRSKLRKISRMAKAAGRPWFVFVNSLSDFWDNQADPALRGEALAEFRKHPHLTFLLLTKRPQNILKMARTMCEWELGPYVDSDGGLAAWWPKNVAIGCTVVTQQEADRDVPWLLRAKTALKPAFAFLSMEPLMGPVDLTRIHLGVQETVGYGPKRIYWDALTGWEHQCRPDQSLGAGEYGRMACSGPERRVDWVITGGESGAHARPSDPAWFRSLRDQCAAAGVAFQHKQNGEWVAASEIGEIPLRVDCYEMLSARLYRIGKKADPCTIDGVLHRARPQLAEAA